MPRNEPKSLSLVEHANQRVRQSHLADCMDREVTVTVSYVKRDGSASSSTGKVAYFNGRPGFDTGSVTINTEDKGPRTVNLHNITRIIEL